MNTDQYRAYERERKRAYRARTGGTTRAALKPFCGIDGEGGNINGRHEYLLLRAGDHVLETGSPLTWQECLGFIAGLPKDVCYVGYFFDYDVTMMLRGCREERIRRLLDRAARTPAVGGSPFAVEIDGFFVDYMPRKEFRVRLGKDGPYTVISDVGPFFQCAFLKSLTAWNIGTPAQREDIAAGKLGRADFAELTDETRRYNGLEIDLLEQLMEAFRAVCVETGYVPAKWQGPGYMAASMFRAHGIPTRKRLAVSANTELMADANAAYYGGRFEVTRSGPVAGPIFQYDICSAYPAALTELPCLEHSEWTRNDKPTDDGLYLAYGSFECTSDAHLYAFPVRRDNGSIYYPAQGRGYYWSTEIGAARHQRLNTEYIWQCTRRCDCSPFGWVPGVYADRLRLGKTARGLVLKLGLNSLYGKTAQSIGSATYGSPIWAGLITSITRAKLLDLICTSAAHDLGQCGQDVLMLATDGVFTTAPRTPTIGTQLGEWEEDIHSDIFLIQPGLYFTAGNSHPKTRGLPQSKVIESAELFRASYETRTPVPVTLHSFVGLRQAVHRNRFADLAGTWQDISKDITWDLSSKRDADGRPYPGSMDTETVPYSKDIGRWRDMERLDLADQPDWADTLDI
jgi:hypothetical protein